VLLVNGSGSTSDAARELSEISDIIAQVFARIRSPIRLTKFKDEPSIYRVIIFSLSGLIKTHLPPLAQEQSEHWWLLRVPTPVSDYFAKKPFKFSESTRSPNLSAPTPQP
jgi:hypothetical protein